MILFNCARFNLIQLGINLQYIPTLSRLRSKWIITIYEEKKYINQVGNWEKNIKRYHPTPVSENMLSNLFEMLGPYFCSNCRDLRYLKCFYLKNREKDPSMIFLFHWSRDLLCRLKGVYSDMRIFLVPPMTFLLHQWHF